MKGRGEDDIRICESREDKKTKALRLTLLLVFLSSALISVVSSAELLLRLDHDDDGLSD